MRRPQASSATLVCTALATLISALLVAPAAVLAAAVTFGSPSASSAYLKNITFVQPVDISTVPSRVELLLEEPGQPGLAVTEVPPPTQTGHVQLRNALDTSTGQVLTNATLTARWRLTFQDGTSETGPTVSVTYADTRFQWRTLAGSVVRIHWYEGSDAFARQAAALGDRAIEQAATLLGVSETEPVDFFIYADQQAFSDALGPGSHENVAGEAHPEIRTMFGLISPDEIGTAEVSRVVTHELTHLVFDTATKNPYHEPVHWLNEGVAVYLSQGFDSSDRGLVSQAVDNRTIMPLAALVANWPSAYDRFALAYAEAVSAVDFIIRTYGQEALVHLIRSYADGVTDDEAFRAALGLDTKAFDAAWLTSIGASTPSAFGPQPAPPGPTPAGWTSGGAAPSSATPGSSASGGATAPTASAVTSTGTAGGPESGNDGGSPVAGFVVPSAVVLLAVGGLGLVMMAVRRRTPGGPR